MECARPVTVITLESQAGQCCLSGLPVRHRFDSLELLAGDIALEVSSRDELPLASNRLGLRRSAVGGPHVGIPTSIAFRQTVGKSLQGWFGSEIVIE